MNGCGLGPGGDKCNWTTDAANELGPFPARSEHNPEKNQEGLHASIRANCGGQYENPSNNGFHRINRAMKLTGDAANSDTLPIVGCKDQFKNRNIPALEKSHVEASREPFEGTAPGAWPHAGGVCRTRRDVIQVLSGGRGGQEGRVAALHAGPAGGGLRAGGL
jgi:hypothetical protein